MTRRRAVPIGFGWWREPDGRRGHLEWNPIGGHLVYIDANRRPELIATITEEPMVRIRLLDWADHTEEGIGWARERVADHHRPNLPTDDELDALEAAGVDDRLIQRMVDQRFAQCDEARGEW